VFNVIKFLFRLFFFYYSIIVLFVVLPFMVKSWFSMKVENCFNRAIVRNCGTARAKHQL